jgi:hypothetical protein
LPRAAWDDDFHDFTFAFFGGYEGAGASWSTPHPDALQASGTVWQISGIFYLGQRADKWATEMAFLTLTVAESCAWTSRESV